MPVWMFAVGLTCVAVAILHGYLGHAKLIGPTSFATPEAKGLVEAIWQFSTVAWVVSGVIIAASPWIFTAEQRMEYVAMACLPLAYGACANAVITRGRHFGWKLLTMIIAGAIGGTAVASP